MATKFLHCDECGNILSVIGGNGDMPDGCAVLKEIEAGVVEASREKHLPVVTVESTDYGMRLSVAVGSVAHPMIDAHFIEWIYVETDKGGHLRTLKPGEAPAAVFHIADDELPTAVYAYCNLHGLWKTAL